jgi:hypothetical protein
MVKLYTLFLLLSILLSPLLKAQNEFYIQDGAIVSINNQVGTIGQTSVSDMPTLYVDGDIINLNDGVIGKGFFNSLGEIQITGNFVNTSGGYSSTGDEVFVGSTIQRLSGGFIGSNSRLHNMIVDKTSNAIIELNSDLEVSNILRFNSGGRIRTDIQSHGTNGSAYNNKVVFSSPSSGGLVGYNTSGADKYIEGKLERAVSGANNYFFPIGVEPGSWDGIEPFEINFASATASSITGYVFPKNINLIGKNVFHDINADGLYDLITIDCELPLQWSVNSSGGTYSYSITFYPGTAVETCEWENSFGTPLSFAARDGLIGNAVEVAAPFPFAGQGTGFITAPNGYTLSGLNSFSNFTLPGKSDLTPPILPVELISFIAYPANNYIELEWITASEVNNDGFVVERSLDGITFEKIGYVDGNGTTNEKTIYTFQDDSVQYNRLYYYRLKQIDFDGTTSYSNIVSAKLIFNQLEGWTVSNFFPSPSVSNSYIQISTDKDIELDYMFYDVLGKVLEAKRQFFQKGIHIIKYDIEQLPGGIYFLSISNSEANYIRKLTKLSDN